MMLCLTLNVMRFKVRSASFPESDTFRYVYIYLQTPAYPAPTDKVHDSLENIPVKEADSYLGFVNTKTQLEKNKGG